MARLRANPARSPSTAHRLKVQLAVRVSVLMPVYNAERYVGEAIASILAQTFPDFELVVVDDGSTDGTAEVLDACGDPRMRRYRNEGNLGIPATRNLSLSLARGEYVAWMDADDRSLPERLARQVEFMDAHPEIVSLSTGICTIDEAGQAVRQFRIVAAPEAVRGRLLLENCLGTNGCVMVRTAVIRGLGGYRPVVAEDYDLFLRLTDWQPCACSLSEYLYEYRVHSDSDMGRRSSAYEMAPLILQHSARMRRAMAPDPVASMTAADFLAAAEDLAARTGALSRACRCTAEWAEALGRHAAGDRVGWLNHLARVLWLWPGYPPLWASLRSACRRRLRPEAARGR